MREWDPEKDYDSEMKTVEAARAALAEWEGKV